MTVSVIGVAVKPEDLPVAEEFFELFKAPWEPAVPGRKYDVILAADMPVSAFDASSFVIYGATAHDVDELAGVRIERRPFPIEATRGTRSLPLYDHVCVFDGLRSQATPGFLRVSDVSADYRCTSGGAFIHRIGYDLFREVRHLLTHGQPASRAGEPTLDRHIELLRDVLLDLGVAFVEIVPRPGKFDFACCLTHDVDFCGIRRHGLDRTMLGFVARASIGTVIDLVRSRRTIADAVRNWVALVSLPLVFLRLRPDFWDPFADYTVADRGHVSTFFLIPFRHTPGAPGLNQHQNDGRAVSYQASDVRDQAQVVAAAGSELAVHGIDAWHSTEAARAEMAELSAITGGSVPGVRMHWLFYDDARSPERLEAAGFEYDSTCGFNDAVGFRAGTSQVFRPLSRRRLLELPLSIMDSALFFPGRMGLRPDEAKPLCGAIVDHARRAGGTVVINWHDRSLAPERLWNAAYDELLNEVERDDRAWFTTARNAVRWYDWRRSIRFDATDDGAVVVDGPAVPAGLPGARVVVHRPSPARREDRDLETIDYGGGAAMRVCL